MASIWHHDFIIVDRGKPNELVRAVPESEAVVPPPASCKGGLSSRFVATIWDFKRYPNRYPTRYPSQTPRFSSIVKVFQSTKSLHNAQEKHEKHQKHEKHLSSRTITRSSGAPLRCKLQATAVCEENARAEVLDIARAGPGRRG